MFHSRVTTLLTIVSVSLLLIFLGGSRLVSAENPPAPIPRTMMEPEFPTITGTLNNPITPTWGSTHTQLRRISSPAYADGMSEPRGGGIALPATLPSTRDISNIVATQSTLITNTHGVSDLFWQMFQFLDHDLDLTEAATPAEPFNIAVTLPDPLLTKY